MNWARILNASVFCNPVKFFIRLKIRPTPCERSLKLFCVFLRWHLKIPVSDCWIQKNYNRTLLTNGHLFTAATLFCPGGQSIHYVRCKFTCKLAFIWTKQTNPYNQGYIRRTRQSNPYKQEYISSVSSVKNVVTSCESLQRVTPYNNKNSSRDLKGRETGNPAATHWLLFKPLYNGNGDKSVSPTAKIISRQRPVFSATDEKVKNGHEIWYVWRTNPQI